MKPAKVWIEKNQYKFKGEFHEIEANQPIRNAQGALAGVTNPRHLVHVHSYGGEAPFFAGLAEGKLLGTKCVNSKCEYKGAIHLPFRIYCPDCLRRAKIVDLTGVAQKTAKIYSFVVTSRTGAFNTIETPIRFIDVELKGVVTILKSYQLVGEPDIGQRVVPIFRTTSPTYTITDLAFVKLGTKEKDLPKGFSF